MHIELKLDEATKTLKTCQGQANGCEPSKEDALRLNQKHVRECVDVRRRHDHEIAWRMIYSCLWKHRALPLIHSIETWFTVPSVDMSSGCNKLRPLADPSVVDAKQCLCEEWDAVSKLEEKAKEAAQEVHAEEEVVDATKAFQEKETEEKKRCGVGILFWSALSNNLDAVREYLSAAGRDEPSKSGRLCSLRHDHSQMFTLFHIRLNALHIGELMCVYERDCNCDIAHFCVFSA